MAEGGGGMKQTTTIYVCDGCKTTVERARDLRPFRLSAKPRPGSYMEPPTVRADLCVSCEDALITGLVTFFDDAELAELRRPVAAETTGNTA